MQPTSNTNDFYGIKVSIPGINVSQASDKQLLYQNNYSTETFFDGSGNARVLLGQLPDNSYGLWVSAPEVNATTANPAIPGQLVFNSNNQTYNIADTNLTEMPALAISNFGVLTGNTKIPHGLGFTPILVAYALMQPFIDGSGDFVTSYVPMPINIYEGLSVYNNIVPIQTFQLFASADTENIYITWGIYTNGTVGQGGAQPAIPIQYYLQSVATV